MSHLITVPYLTSGQLQGVITTINSFYDLLAEGVCVTDADVVDAEGHILGKLIIDDENTYHFVAGGA
jgi:hypothetical protein